MQKNRVFSRRKALPPAVKPSIFPALSNRKTLSSSGLGHCPFTAVTGVRIPLGSPLFSGTKNTCPSLKQTPLLPPIGKAAQPPETKRNARHRAEIGSSLSETAKTSSEAKNAIRRRQIGIKVSGVSDYQFWLLRTFNHELRKGGLSQPSSKLCPSLTPDPWHGPPPRRRSLSHVPGTAAARNCRSSCPRFSTLQNNREDNCAAFANQLLARKGGRP